VSSSSGQVLSGSPYSEDGLETALVDKLQYLLLERGRGFLVEVRQKRFTWTTTTFL
jgi:predicted nuclease of restriction endonuclease-like (RecB) superfamily